ncbi:ketopantoate reductase family protein [Staphylospora marina]|uniref:ketopantoate reductase family protein n=1 Tax=Staphylospora marina TaxID=2490858 RepID=UPI000F5BB348|nr:ketopantoate reductase family protein [Staphylospora marina]
MRTLVVGAGAVGGYFGGRLAEKGADVTFLVRPRRAAQLQREGLVIRSRHGDALLRVKTVLSDEIRQPFDLVILSVKAYHLPDVRESLGAAVGERTVVLPLLNGIRHMDLLKQWFGPEKVLGGLCFVEATLNKHGHVLQYSPRHELVYGETDGSDSPRVRRIQALLAGANMESRLSTEIMKDMWMKYAFIAGFSGMTCLMRSPLGPILKAPGGKETYLRLLEEIHAVARHHEPSLPEDLAATILAQMESLNESMKSSMLRDMEKGLPVEADHLQGSLLEMAPPGTDLPLLKAVYASLKAYEQTR